MERTSSKMGKNRTGVQMSPKATEAMLAFTQQRQPTSHGDESGIAALRQSYIEEGDEVGSVPLPGTAKGMLKSGAKMMTGSRPQALVDKLAERLAFERTGTRLYTALITKHRSDVEGQVPIDQLVRFRDDEAQHVALLAEALQQLGADPTAQTPGADLVGVESMGLMQAITDPRTTFAQSLHAILVAELADHEGWDLLIALAESEGHKDLAQRFAAALDEEQTHLDHVRRWVSALTMGEARVGVPS